jgi:hypothetical protein
VSGVATVYAPSHSVGRSMCIERAERVSNVVPDLFQVCQLQICSRDEGLEFLGAFGHPICGFLLIGDLSFRLFLLGWSATCVKVT